MVKRLRTAIGLIQELNSTKVSLWYSTKNQSEYRKDNPPPFTANRSKPFHRVWHLGV